MTLEAKILVPGSVAADIAALRSPLSLWGGFDPVTGMIIDRNHPDCGLSLRGKIVVMPYARGSSSSSSVLLEAARTGQAPAAFILNKNDPILAVGALVASELYGCDIPILIVVNGWDVLTAAKHAKLAADPSERQCLVELSPD